MQIRDIKNYVQVTQQLECAYTSIERTNKKEIEA